MHLINFIFVSAAAAATVGLFFVFIIANLDMMPQLKTIIQHALLHYYNCTALFGVGSSGGCNNNVCLKHTTWCVHDSLLPYRNSTTPNMSQQVRKKENI